jgi:hypothetical protein
MLHKPGDSYSYYCQSGSLSATVPHSAVGNNAAERIFTYYYLPVFPFNDFRLPFVDCI